MKGRREGETERGKKGGREKEKERKGERERERGRGRLGTKHVPQGHAPVTYFLQLGPTFCEFYHFLIVHSIMNPSIG